MRPYLQHLYSPTNKKSNHNNHHHKSNQQDDHSNSLSIVSSNSKKVVIVSDKEEQISFSEITSDHKLIKPSSFRIQKGIIQDSNRDDFLRTHFNNFRTQSHQQSQQQTISRTNSSPNIEKSKQKTEKLRNHHHNQHRNSLSHKKTVHPYQPETTATDKLDLPSCIMNSLYLGDCFQATNKKSIDHFKITHVINCTKNVENKFEISAAGGGDNHEHPHHHLEHVVSNTNDDVSEINLEDSCVKIMEQTTTTTDHLHQDSNSSGGLNLKYLRIPIDDVETENIFQYFPETFQFIEQAMSDSGIILVHCAAGVSRSSSIVISYVMKKMGVPFMFAFNLVKRRRRMIMPNEGFFNQLLEWERKLNGGKSISQFKDGYMDLLEIEQQMYSSY